MAKRLGAKSAGKPTTTAGSPQASSAGDVSVLHPHRQISIAGRMVMVREYGYIEGLKIQSGVQPFLDSLFALFAVATEPPSAEAVRSVFVGHIDAVQWMIAQAITPVADDPQLFVQGITDSMKWIATLGDVDGDLLTTVWWGVNTGFFIRRLRERALAEKAKASRSASGSSTPP